MKIILYILLVVPYLLMAQIKSFPNAAGGGAESIGGRHKILYIVNTLDYDASANFYAASGGNDAYFTGGLEQAITNPNVGHIVFNVSGNIQLPTDGVSYSGVSNKSIYGQSAPEGGITIWGGRFKFDYTTNDNHDLIFRYFRSRPVLSRHGYTPDVALDFDFGQSSLGDDAYTWAFLFTGGYNIIVDHCSASFSYDKNMGGFIWDASDVMDGFTFSHNLSADGLTNMYFEINDGRPTGTQNIPDNISILNNVINISNRTPNMSYGGYGEVVNNIIHDVPYKYTTSFWNIKLNQIGNYYSGEDKWSGNSAVFARNRIVSTGTSSTEPNSKPEIYTNSNYLIKDDNTIVLNGDVSNNDRILWSNYVDGFLPAPPQFGGQPQFFTDTKHTNDIVYKYTETTPQQAFTNLITNGDVGAYKYLDVNGYVQIYRDSFDANQLNLVANNDVSYVGKQAANWVLPTIPNNTRPASYDTDNDGMCDAWEIRNFGDLSQSYRGDYNNNGRNNIEDYMNMVDGGYTPPPNPGEPTGKSYINQKKLLFR